MYCSPGKIQKKLKRRVIAVAGQTDPLVVTSDDSLLVVHRADGLCGD